MGFELLQYPLGLGSRRCQGATLIAFGRRGQQAQIGRKLLTSHGLPPNHQNLLKNVILLSLNIFNQKISAALRGI